jgi:hypothetical protein
MVIPISVDDRDDTVVAAAQRRKLVRLLQVDRAVAFIRTERTLLRVPAGLRFFLQRRLEIGSHHPEALHAIRARRHRTEPTYGIHRSERNVAARRTDQRVGRHRGVLCFERLRLRNERLTHRIARACCEGNDGQ